MKFNKEKIKKLVRSNLLILFMLFTLIAISNCNNQAVENLKKQNARQAETIRQQWQRLNNLVNFNTEKSILYMALFFLFFSVLNIVDRQLDHRMIFGALATIISRMQFIEPEQRSARRGIPKENIEEVKFVDIKPSTAKQKNHVVDNNADSEPEPKDEKAEHWEASVRAFKRKQKTKDELGEEAANEIERDYLRRLDQENNDGY